VAIRAVTSVIIPLSSSESVLGRQKIVKKSPSKYLLLAIYIDLKNIDVNTKSVLLRDMELEFFPNDNNLTHYYNIIYRENTYKVDFQDSSSFDPGATKGVELNENLDHINRIKHKIRDILIKNSIDEYVVTRDRKATNTILMMKRTRGESIGVFHCRYWAMEFDDEIQLSNHLRMHFFI